MKALDLLFYRELERVQNLQAERVTDGERLAIYRHVP